MKHFSCTVISILFKREQELHESWWELRREFVWELSQLSCPGQTRTRVAWELVRVEKREFVWKFSQLSFPGETRIRVAWELMRVEKQEFVWKFSQLSFPGETRTRVAWEWIRVKKREFAWELRSESLCYDYSFPWLPVGQDRRRTPVWISCHSQQRDVPSAERWIRIQCHLRMNGK